MLHGVPTTLAGLAAQTGGDHVTFAPNLFQPAVESGVGLFLTTLVGGGLLVVLRPDYTRDRMAYLREDPLASLVYGVAGGLVVVVGTVGFLILVVSELGLGGAYAMMGGMVLTTVVWVTGVAISLLALADLATGLGDDWPTLVVAAAAANGILGLTLAGALVSGCLAMAGLGSVVADWFGRG
ncbi:hypothetical protein [Haloarchaeobius sp. DYHT-AS-18]|uniref:hypothetical protein n=1 Tax=Haloarchaeobius sp. DYHT-AS-18 TaxID=3446117 RepID=UPI003EB84D50